MIRRMIEINSLAKRYDHASMVVAQYWQTRAAMYVRQRIESSAQCRLVPTPSDLSGDRGTGC